MASGSGKKQESSASEEEKYLTWTIAEQDILEDGLARYVTEPLLIRYMKIAAVLPYKSIAEVAHRVKWMCDVAERKGPNTRVWQGMEKAEQKIANQAKNSKNQNNKKNKRAKGKSTNTKGQSSGSKTESCSSDVRTSSADVRASNAELMKENEKVLEELKEHLASLQQIKEDYRKLGYESDKDVPTGTEEGMEELPPLPEDLYVDDVFEFDWNFDFEATHDEDDEGHDSAPESSSADK